MSPFTGARERINVVPVNESIVSSLASQLRIPPVAARILAARNFTDVEMCKRFFNPRLEDLYDPFLFHDMEKATSRIARALVHHEKIAVYGDYDVDGVSGTSMLVRALRSAGGDCSFHLPYRLTDGYGVSSGLVSRIADSGATLMITVDCGITANEEIAQATAAGIDVIVTDHHEPKDTLPPAYAILNPKVSGSGYPDADLAGVGVVFKLCQALGTATGRDAELWEPYLDLAALGTAADIVPLRGENRIIARFGFERMRKTKNPGLAALVDLQGLTGKPLTTSDVVFQLAPCINAAGRIGDPSRAVELLLTDDPAIAAERANDLRNANFERRSIDSGVWDEALAWVTEHCDNERDVSIVTGSANWHPGVIGIVASKLVERFHRPAVLFSIHADGTARGSGRSIPGVHLLDALGECSDLLQEFGGHAAAAGLSCSSGSIAEFRERFNRVIAGRVQPEDLVPTVRADAEVELSALTPELFNWIRSMEPFGPGNMQPVLYCNNLRHRYAPRIVGRGHLKMTVTSGGFIMDAIGFNFGDRLDELSGSVSLSLAFTLDENEWNGRKSLQMKVKGISV